MNAEGKVEQRRIEFCLTEEEFDLLQSALGGYVIYTRSKNPREANRVQSLADKVIAAHAPSVAPPPRGEKRPIARPCSACGDGDTEMEYHDHYPPFADGAPSVTEAPAPTKRMMVSYPGLPSDEPHEESPDCRAQGCIPLEKLQCRNPNHTCADGSPHPHEIGPSCMAESAPALSEDELYSRHMAELESNWHVHPIPPEDRMWINGYKRGWLRHRMRSAPALSESEETIATRKADEFYSKTYGTKPDRTYPAYKNVKQMVLDLIAAFKAGALGDTKEKA